MKDQENRFREWCWIPNSMHALNSVVLIFREADNHILILFESYIKIHLLSHVSRNGRWSGWYGGGIVVVYIKKSA